MKFRAWIIVGLIAFCGACRHAKPVDERGFPTPPIAPRPRSDPKVIVHGSNTAPIQYDWTFTNSPDGNRVLKFSPGH